MLADSPVGTSDRCRVSGAALTPVLDLGEHRVNDFPLPGEHQSFARRLRLMVGDGFVQLGETVDPNLLFRRYWYRSGTNEAMQRHLGGIVSDGITRTGFQPGDAWLDIGCNDGTLLARVPRGHRVGFDPSLIEPEHVDVFVNDFFRADLYPVDMPKPKVITTIAMLYDLADPVTFAREVASLLPWHGLWITEQHYLGAMIEGVTFDAICHEHVFYYSVAALRKVVEMAGLVIQDVRRNDVNGGSFRAYITHANGTRPSPCVEAMIAAERWYDLAGFRDAVNRNVCAVRDMVYHLRNGGCRVAAIGASTKGNTLLQRYEFGPDQIPFVMDRAPEKWGRTTITGIPIVSEEEGRARTPDVLLALPYHFLPGFMERERAFVERGGQFLVPVPMPRLVP